VLKSGKVADVDVDVDQLDQAGQRRDLHTGRRRIPARFSRLVGRTAYPLTALAELSGHKPFHARMLVGDAVHQVHTHQLSIANGSFHAGCLITADACADDRLLLGYPSAARTAAS
jgi:diacylglycerol kinase (ATP)